MEPASLTAWLQPPQFTTQSIQSVWKCQVLFRILQTLKNRNLLFIGQMIKSQSEKCLAQNESNISVGVHVGSSQIKAKDTHLMNDNQPVAEILCWRLISERAYLSPGRQFHAIVIFRLKSISDLDSGSLPRLYGEFVYAKLKILVS